MKRTEIFLPRFGWRVDVFIDFDCDKTETILGMMKSLGCGQKTLQEARESLEDCEENSGMTFSSRKYRNSVLVLHRQGSFKEFINTLAHEISHVCAHIAIGGGERLDEEDFCYAAGDLMGSMSEIILDYLGCEE